MERYEAPVDCNASLDTNADKRFDPFMVDTDNDDLKSSTGSIGDLYAQKSSPKGGKPFHILGLHLKSKGIFEAYEWSKWWEKADANRKKILAQATQIRVKFLDPFRTDSTTSSPLIVCGDINDGPGLDACEKRLFGSGVERLMRMIWKPQLCLGNALFDTLSAKDKEEVDFSSIYTTTFKDPIFNDTYQREWIDHILYSKNQISEWVTGGQIHSKMPDGTLIYTRYKHASDHFPISVDINT